MVKYLGLLNAYSQYSIDYALIRASSGGHLDVVKYLVSLGANVKHDTYCCIRSAFVRHRLEVVQYLVSFVGDVREIIEDFVWFNSLRGMKMDYIYELAEFLGLV